MAKEETKASTQATPATRPPQPQQPAALNVSQKPRLTAAELVSHLRESGTPPKRYQPLEQLLKDSPQADAEAAYRILEEEKVPLGTLRKAGKFVFGDTFEPDQPGAVPAEELEALRQQVANLTRELERANQDKLAYLRQRNAQIERNNELVNKNRLLIAGRSREELAALGAE